MGNLQMPGKNKTISLKRRSILYWGCGIGVALATGYSAKPFWSRIISSNHEASGEGFELMRAGDESFYSRVSGTVRTLLVQVHSWSSTKEEILASPALKSIRDCVWICPDFGGQNNHPKACGHPEQLERIKRAIDETRYRYASIERVILFGVSGGGYTSLMFMAAYPGTVYGASLWVFPYDLADWWERKPIFRESLESCMGGAPEQRAKEYTLRSPMSAVISGYKLYLNGSPQDEQVPFSHQLQAKEHLSSSNDVEFRAFDGGHKVEWDIAVKQIQLMQPAK